MDIKLDETTLGGKKLFIGTPMYGGQCYHEYMHGLLELQYLCLQYGVEFKLVTTCNMSLVQTARNHIVQQFLETDYTHLAFIDADVGFKAIEVLAMLALDKDIIGGAYPRKQINWSNIREVILTNPDIELSELEHIVGTFPILPVEESGTYLSGEPMKVQGTGTGLMIINRDVFAKFREEYPEYAFEPDGQSYDINDPKSVKPETEHSYFNVEITSVVEQGRSKKVIMGEDYKFCVMCREIGYDVWYAPFVNCTHSGTYSFKGNISTISKYIHEGKVN